MPVPPRAEVASTSGNAAGCLASAAVIAAINKALTKHPAAFPEVLATSARGGAGIPELRAAIARLVAERASA